MKALQMDWIFPMKFSSALCLSHPESGKKVIFFTALLYSPMNAVGGDWVEGGAEERWIFKILVKQLITVVIWGGVNGTLTQNSLWIYLRAGVNDSLHTDWSGLQSAGHSTSAEAKKKCGPCLFTEQCQTWVQHVRVSEWTHDCGHMLM